MEAEETEDAIESMSASGRTYEKEYQHAAEMREAVEYAITKCFHHLS